MTDRPPSLRPILFSNKHIIIKLAKFLVLLLTPLASNDYTIKNSFSFAEGVPAFDCAHYMTIFDIECLFTNTQLEETINICVDKLFQNKMKVENLTQESFCYLLELAILDSLFFIFDKKCSK